MCTVSLVVSDGIFRYLRTHMRPISPVVTAETGNIRQPIFELDVVSLKTLEAGNGLLSVKGAIRESSPNFTVTSGLLILNISGSLGL